MDPSSGGGLTMQLSAAPTDASPTATALSGEVLTEVASVAAKKVHVSNLPPGTTEQHLIEIFSPCGPISFVRIIVNQNEHVFAFVEFMDAGGASAAFALNGVTLGGCQLKISSATNAVHAQPYVKRDKGLMRKLSELNSKLESRGDDPQEKSKSRSPSPKPRQEKAQSPAGTGSRSTPSKTATACKDGIAYIPFRSSKHPATPLDHLTCVRKALIDRNPSLNLDEDGIIINVDKDGRLDFEDGKNVDAVVEVEGVSDCSHLVVPDTATFSASDKSNHTVVFPTAKAYISYKEAFRIAEGRSRRNSASRSRSRSRSRRRSRSRSSRRRRSPSPDRRGRRSRDRRDRDRRDRSRGRERDRDRGRDRDRDRDYRGSRFHPYGAPYRPPR